MYRYKYQNIEYSVTRESTKTKKKNYSLASSLPHLDGGFQFIPPVLSLLNCSIHVPSLLCDMHLTRGKKNFQLSKYSLFKRIFYFFYFF